MIMRKIQRIIVGLLICGELAVSTPTATYASAEEIEATVLESSLITEESASSGEQGEGGQAAVHQSDPGEQGEGEETTVYQPEISEQSGGEQTSTSEQSEDGPAFNIDQSRSGEQDAEARQTDEPQQLGEQLEEDQLIEESFQPEDLAGSEQVGTDAFTEKTELLPEETTPEKVDADGASAGDNLPVQAGSDYFRVTGPVSSYSYVKGGVKPEIVVTSGSETLQSGKDYTVKYANYSKPGTAKITVTGKGIYAGSKEIISYQITARDISECLMFAGDVVYNPKKKGFIKPAIYINDINGAALKAGTDFYTNYTYKASGIADGYSEVLPTGCEVTITATGKGCYSGTISATYTIVAASIAKASVKTYTVYWDEKYADEGVKLDPDNLIVTLGGAIVPYKSYDPNLGTETENYIILDNSYVNNKKTGKASVMIRGVGNYGGLKKITFTLSPKSRYHSVVFNPGGATSGKMGDKRMQVGKSYKLPSNSFKKKGYTFAGWSTTPEGQREYLNKEYYQSGLPVSESQAGTVTTLYAQWEPVEYTINYYGSADYTHSNTLTYIYEDTRYAGIPLSNAEREGYDFGGWFLDKKCSVKKQIYEIPKGSASNLTIYPKWIIPKIGLSSEEVSKIYENTENYLNPVKDAAFAVIPDDGKDDTAGLNAAIQSVAAGATPSEPATVYLPEGIYNISPSYYGIELESNVNLVMDRSAILKCSAAETPDGNDYHVISVIDEVSGHIENVKVIGGQIQGERNIHRGENGSYRGHGVAIWGATNVLIADMVIADNWGDGVYVGTKKEFDTYYGCKNVTIQNCDIHGNRRNNISIVDADGLVVEKCSIYDAYGIEPQCGILIEPNFEAGRDESEARCSDIIIRNNTITAYKKKNSSSYMCFLTNYNPYDRSYVVVDGLRVENNTFNGWYGMYSGYRYSESGNTFKGTKVVGDFVN